MTLGVTTPNGRWSPISTLGCYQRSRRSRRYREGTIWSFPARVTRSPGISRCTEKFTRETRFPSFRRSRNYRRYQEAMSNDDHRN